MILPKKKTKNRCCGCVFFLSFLFLSFPKKTEVLERSLHPYYTLLVVLDCLCSLQSTSTSGSNKTNLHTWRSHSGHGRWVTNMLMVTTTVRMLYRVHGNTSHLWPAVTLHLVLVVGGTGLQHRLLGTTTSSDLTHHSSAAAWNELLASAWELHSRESGVWVVGNDDAEGSGGSGNGGPVSSVSLDVGDDGSLRHGADVEHVSDGQGRLLSSVDEHTGVHTLDCAHGFLLLLVPDRVSEGHSGERSTSTRVVNKLLHDALDVPISLAVVEATKLRSALTRAGDGLENATVTLTLTTNHATHNCLVSSSLLDFLPSLLATGVAAS